MLRRLNRIKHHLIIPTAFHFLVAIVHHTGCFGGKLAGLVHEYAAGAAEVYHGLALAIELRSQLF